MSSIGDLAFLVNDNFDKPLNRQIQDMIGLLANSEQLYTQKSFEQIYKLEQITIPVTSTEDYYNPNSYSVLLDFPSKLNINCSGSIYLGVNLNGSMMKENAYDYTYAIGIFVYKNDELVRSAYVQTDNTINGLFSYSGINSKVLLSINKSDNITVKLGIKNYVYGGVSSLTFSKFTANCNINIYAVPALIGTNLITTEQNEVSE